MGRDRMTLSDRIQIESGLYAKRTLKQIAASMGRSVSTISREIRNNRTMVAGERLRGKDCAYAGRCFTKGVCGDIECQDRCSLWHKYDCTTLCKRVKNLNCLQLEKPPFVCNTCPDRRKCRKNRAYYIAQQAEDMSKRRRSDSRRGMHLSEEELAQLDALVTPLVKKGQPLTHIWASHREELGVSERTLYNYIDAGVLSLSNLDLRRKVGYKPRKKKKEIKNAVNKAYLEGRRYEDYLFYLRMHPQIQPVEMDTVKGCREKGKRLLNMVFCENNLMLSFLMPDNKANSVISVFDFLTSVLGLNRFRELFPVILTDNGSEFKRVMDLELTKDGEQRTKIFYCDPYSSWQKPHIEKNQEYIRYVLPKGQSLNGYTQEDITLLTNHINSTRRTKLGYGSPYECVSSDEMRTLMDALGLREIPQDEICLSRKLLRRAGPNK